MEEEEVVRGDVQTRLGGAASDGDGADFGVQGVLDCLVRCSEEDDIDIVAWEGIWMLI